MNKEHLHSEGRPYTKEEFVEKIKTDNSVKKRPPIVYKKIPNFRSLTEYWENSSLSSCSVFIVLFI